MKSADLLTSLNLVRPALSIKPYSPILTHFCFNDKRVEAYNGELYVGADTEVDFDLAVPGDFLYRFVSTLKKDIKFKTNKDNLVTLTSGKSVNKLQGLPAKDFNCPVISEDDKPDITLTITEKFIDAIRDLLPFTGDDQLFPQYIGLLATSDYIYATNGRVISRAKIKLDLKSNIFIPKSFCIELIRLISELETIEIFDNFITAYGTKGNKVEVIHSIPDVKFPDCKGMFTSFKKHLKTNVVDISDEFLDCFERINLVSQGLIDKNCSIKFDKDCVEFDLDNKSFSHLNEKVEIKGCKIKDEVEVFIPSLFSCSKISDKFGVVDSGKSKVLYFIAEDSKIDILVSLVG
tara:strand:- start:36179 stop:37222 length:1044 start_codon:yes stop_codon:yes gene_type:complete